MGSQKNSVLSDAALLAQWPHGMDLMKQVRDRYGDKILLGFSRGKDSIAAWIAMRDSGLFKKIIPVHLYIIPDMEFVNEDLKYWEDMFHTHIINIPHRYLATSIKSHLFQPPGRLFSNLDFFLEEEQIGVLEQNDMIKLQYGVPTRAIMANGVRALDSLPRRMSIHRHGPISKLRRNVKIIWEWSAKQCYQIIKDNGFRLPVDYEMWGRSFDGIGYQWLKPLRERFPNDYQKIVDWFPLIELEFFRFEQLENKPEAWK